MNNSESLFDSFIHKISKLYINRVNMSRKTKKRSSNDKDYFSNDIILNSKVFSIIASQINSFPF